MPSLFRPSGPVNAAQTLQCAFCAASASVDSMTQGSRAFTSVGLPLFVLVVGGFYGLSTLVQGKFDAQVDLNDVVQ